MPQIALFQSLLGILKSFFQLSYYPFLDLFQSLLGILKSHFIFAHHSDFS